MFLPGPGIKTPTKSTIFIKLLLSILPFFPSFITKLLYQYFNIYILQLSDFPQLAGLDNFGALFCPTAILWNFTINPQEIFMQILNVFLIQRVFEVIPVADERYGCTNLCILFFIFSWRSFILADSSRHRMETLEWRLRN